MSVATTEQPPQTKSPATSQFSGGSHEDLPVYLTTGDAALVCGIRKDQLMKAIEQAPTNPPGAIIGGRYLLFDKTRIEELIVWLANQGVVARNPNKQSVASLSNPESATTTQSENETTKRVISKWELPNN
jgi:hypothetical protein